MKGAQGYEQPDWAVDQIRRLNGLIEDICEHGVGHPNQEYMQREGFKRPAMGVHGCDGCCCRRRTEETD
jgi:hypothetical protein